MFIYLAKRLLAMIPTLFGITLITFFIVNFAPGDPVGTSMGAGAGGGGDAEGGQNQDRLADAIKAKKQLLGMMREDRAVLAYAASGAVAPGAGEDVASLERRSLAELPVWAHAFAPTPDGRMVVGGDGGLLAALDAGGAVVQTWTGHTASVWAVATSAASIVSASSDGRIRIHDLGTAEPVAEVKGTGRPVRSLAFLPDGASFLAISDDGWIKRFSLAGQEVQAWTGHPSGTTALALLPDGTFWTGGRDRVLRRWAPTGEALEVVEAASPIVNDLEADPTGTRLAVAGEDRVGRVFPIGAGGILGAPVVLAGHTKAVTAVAWVGDRVFTGSRDESVREWDPTSGAQIAQVPVSIGRVHDLRASLDGGAVLVAADAWTVVPVPVRYVKWLGRTLTFDFGRSFVDNEPVLSKIATALPITLGLNLISILLIYLISVPLGIYAAVNRGGWFDSVSSVVVFMLYSMPSFWVATLMIMLFSSVRTLNWFPSVGLHDIGWEEYTGLRMLGDLGMHLVLPIAASVYTGFATLSRYVRTSMLEVIEQDYIRTARAKGLSERVVVLTHAFRNALVVIVTLLGSLLPAMIGGSVVIEYIFSIQGMGLLGFNAILSRDYPMIMAITTLSAVLTLLGILVSDLLYGVVDPRVRVER